MLANPGERTKTVNAAFVNVVKRTITTSGWEDILVQWPVAESASAVENGTVDRVIH